MKKIEMELAKYCWYEIQIFFILAYEHLVERLEWLDYFVFTWIDKQKERICRKRRALKKKIDDGALWLLKKMGTTEGVFIIGVCIALITFCVYQYQLENARADLNNMTTSADAVAAEYADVYQENSVVYAEMEALIMEMYSVNVENEELKAQLKQQRKTTEELNADQIESLIRISAETYGVDPKLALAISRHETGNWRSSLCLYRNNYGGMRSGSGWAHYDSAMAGINSFCRLLKWYKDNGMGTIDTMAYTYCPDNTSQWIAAVRKFYDEV